MKNESACMAETQKRLGNIAGAIYAPRYLSQADMAPVCEEIKDLKEAFRRFGCDKGIILAGHHIA